MAKKTKKKTTKKSTKSLNLPDPREVTRSKIRYKLFLIRLGKYTEDDDLKEYIESQFSNGMTWKNFTFKWDVSPKDPLKVITQDEWVDEGGGMDEVTGKMYPPAFTSQA